MDDLIGFAFVAAWLVVPWVIYFDAKKLGLRSDMGDGLLDMSPGAWWFVSILPFCTMLPAWILYFASRQSLAEKARATAATTPPAGAASAP